MLKENLISKSDYRINFLIEFIVSILQCLDWFYFCLEETMICIHDC